MKQYAAVVDLDEMSDKNYSLNVSGLVDTSAPEEQIDVAAVTREIQSLEATRQEVRNKLESHLKGLGYDI